MTDNPRSLDKIFCEIVWCLNVNPARIDATPKTGVVSPLPKIPLRRRLATHAGVVFSAMAMATTIVHAQSAAAFEEMRIELKKLRDEVDTLKRERGVAQVTPIASAAPPASAAPSSIAAEPGTLGERVTRLEVRKNDAVVLGEGGGLHVPGTDTSIRLYGNAEVHLLHDIGRSGPSDIFTDLAFQPVDSEVGKNPALGLEGKTKLTAQTSRFGIESYTVTPQGPFKTKFEADFYDYSADNRNRLRLRFAYGEYAGFLVGQTWSTFMDLDNLPETVDFNGPVGAPFSRRSMVRYSFGDPLRAKFTVALEDPVDQFNGGSSGERMPQLVLRVDKTFDWGSLNLRGLAHEKRSLTETRRGYGIAVGGNVKLGTSDVLMAQITSVDGDVDQLYGSNGYSIDPLTGAIGFDRNTGLVFGYAKTFSPNLRGSAAFGMNLGETAAAVDNRRLQELFFNLIYSPLKNVEVGAEVIVGKRTTFAGESNTLQRLDFMGRFSF
jgi:hypothetical protein